MTRQPSVRIFIGKVRPEQIIKEGDLTRIRDVEIGLGFHWHRRTDFLLPGEVTLQEEDDGLWSLFNTVGLEQYLTCVISSEMSCDAPLEFLKAHAVISRSWVAGKIGRHAKPSPLGKVNTPGRIIDWQDNADHEGFDVCADDHCQRYQGVGEINRAVVEAVRQTEGLILADADGKPADARFSKCCGGHTELFSTCWQETDMPYLAAKEDPWCDPSLLSEEERQVLIRTSFKTYDRETADRYFRWSEDLPTELVEENLRRICGRDAGKLLTAEPLVRGASGRIKEMRLTGTLGSVVIGKELLIRRIFSRSHLLSSAFTVDNISDGMIRLSGKGWGHGVGLCQIGAAVMAMKGHCYRDILNHYYPTARITRFYGDRT